jgi:chromosome segregation ATPase
MTGVTIKGHSVVHLLRDALALINSQEQRIRELTEQLEAMRGAAEAWKEHSKTLEGENENLKNLVDKCFDTENALNEKVKELTEDVERVAKQCGEIIVECDERDAERLNQVGKLTEENERLENICQSYALQYGTATDKEVFLKQVRADTVRKMQERLSEQFHDRVAYTRSYVHDTIDQIAKEMIEKGD